MNDGETNVLSLPRGPRYGDLFDVVVESMSSTGRGVGTLHLKIGPQAEDRTYRVQVRKAVPGDVLRFRMETNRRGVLEGGIDELSIPSPLRTEPRCAHFGRREQAGKGCGGCTVQSLTYPEQLKLKQEHVARCLSKTGVDDVAVLPPIAQSEPWRYRNKMEFSFAPGPDSSIALGLYPTGWRRTVLPIEDCHLQSVAASRLVRHVAELVSRRGLLPYHPPTGSGFLRTLTIREGKRTDERMLELTTTGDAESSMFGEVRPAEEIIQDLTSELLSIARREGLTLTSLYWTRHVAIRGQKTVFDHHLLSGEPTLSEKLQLPARKALSFAIHPRSFFQTNTRQAEVLYSEVLKQSGVLRGQKIGKALDLYCGTGTIGLCLAPYVSEVVGIELQPDAVKNAISNAADNGITNASFICGDVGKTVAATGLGVTDSVDLAVVDPPRSGLQPDAHQLVASLKTDQIVYVSCNPESLARDLATFHERGWKASAVQPVDMFPHTFHIECVTRLTRA